MIMVSVKQVQLPNIALPSTFYRHWH